MLGGWIDRWSALADDAALGLGTMLETALENTAPGTSVPAADVATHAKTAREHFLAGLREDPGGGGAVGAG